MASIEVGTRFSTIDEAKVAVREWAIDQSLSYKVLKAASAFWVLGCRSSECPFRIRIAINEDGARTRLSCATFILEWITHPPPSHVTTATDFLISHHLVTLVLS